MEEALARGDRREFSSKHLTDQQLGQPCWTAQGITHPDGLRTAPSAGALYPVEICVVKPSGFFHYQPETHSCANPNNYTIKHLEEFRS